MLFVHGLGGSAANWTALMARLGGDLDGEAVDLPGFGESAPPADGDLGLSGHVRAVTGYLEASGRGPVHLFGNSLGGAVAVRLAALRPDLVRSLTLVSPALPELPRSAPPGRPRCSPSQASPRCCAGFRPVRASPSGPPTGCSGSSTATRTA